MKLIYINQRSIGTGEARLVYHETPREPSRPIINLGEQIVVPADNLKPERELPKGAQGVLEMMKMRKGAAEAPAEIDTTAKTEGGKAVDRAMAALGKLGGSVPKAKKGFSPAEKKYAEKTEQTLALAEKAGGLRRQAEAAHKTADQSQRMIGAAERYKTKLDQAAAEETDPLEKIRKEDLAGDAALRVIDAKLAFEKAEKYAKATEVAADKAQKETMVASTEMDKAEVATATQKPDLKDKPKPAKAMPENVANFLKIVRDGTAQAEAREAAANAEEAEAKKRG